MDSYVDMSNSSNCTTPLMPGRIVIAFDATRYGKGQCFKDIIRDILMRERMIQEVDTITLLGVFHKVPHPMGFQMQIGPDSFIGTNAHAIKAEVLRKVDACTRMLRHSAEECGGYGVAVEVKIVVGAPIEKVIAHQVTASNATWIVIDRHLRKSLRFYLKHVHCKVALVLDNISLKILRSHYSNKTTDVIEQQLLYSLSKIVRLSSSDYHEDGGKSVIFSSNRPSTSSHASSDNDKSSSALFLTSILKEQALFSPYEFQSNPQSEESGGNTEVKNEDYNSSLLMQTRGSLKNYAYASVISSPGVIKLELDLIMGRNYGNNGKVEVKHDMDFAAIQKQKHPVMSCPGVHVLLPASNEVKMGYSFSEIQMATNDFSSSNFLGEDECGYVYKGQLEDGQLISVNIQNEENVQAFAEFQLEVHELYFARHRNIVRLLGYCFKQSLSILVFQFVCNKSLEWHLFDNSKYVLEWHKRHAIAIGTAKALRFLHEECWGSPIVHLDVKPSNILLTHDFVPLLGDSGLAKWRENKYLKLRGANKCVAPEYAQNGIFSVKTDSFAFGIVLIQLMSGCKAMDSTKDYSKKSLVRWALPLIQNLAFDEFVDPRLRDSYNTYQVYQMARVARLCVQIEPEMRPTMGEVLRILEGQNNRNLCSI